MAKPYRGADQKFLDACKRAGVQPTHRQWRKWTRGEGSAYKAKSD